MSEPEHADLIVAGAGIAGSVLSCLLARSGFQTLLVDGTRSPPPLLIALTPASRRILHRAGVWAQLPARQIGRFRKIQIWDEQGATLGFDSAELCEPALAWTVELGVLCQAWQRTLHVYREQIQQFPGDICAISQMPDRIQVRLSSGKPLQGTLLAAADGAASALREQCGIPSKVHDYRQQALVCTLRSEQAHQEIARQIFLHDGPLALLPGAEPNLCSLVWSTSQIRAQMLQELDEDDFCAALQQASRNLLGAILQCGDRQVFPLRRMQTLCYQAKRVVLIGDAARVVHPLAGMGANLALLDVATLAEVLETARAKKRNIAGSATLRRYERRRRGQNQIIEPILDVLKWLFENQRPPLPWLRGLGISMMDTLRPGKHWIMRLATGQVGDLPGPARKKTANNSGSD